MAVRVTDPRFAAEWLRVEAVALDDQDGDGAPDGVALMVRDINARYRQSLLGFGWALLPPIVLAFGFTLAPGERPGRRVCDPAQASGRRLTERVRATTTNSPPTGTTHAIGRAYVMQSAPRSAPAARAVSPVRAVDSVCVNGRRTTTASSSVVKAPVM